MIKENSTQASIFILLFILFYCLIHSGLIYLFSVLNLYIPDSYDFIPFLLMAAIYLSNATSFVILKNKGLIFNRNYSYIKHVYIILCAIGFIFIDDGIDRRSRETEIEKQIIEKRKLDSIYQPLKSLTKENQERLQTQLNKLNQKKQK